MSLDNPNKIEKVISWWKSYPHKDIVMYCILALILFAGALWAISVFSSKWQDRQIKTGKEKVENTLKEIANIKAEKDRLDVQEAEKRGELKVDLETLSNATYGRNEAKKEADKALANYDQALKTNTNVNATAEDLKNILEKLQ